MNNKMILYIIIVPIIIWIVTALNIEQYFKKNKGKQIIAFYIVISLGLAYLVVNFIYDFYEVSRII